VTLSLEKVYYLWCRPELSVIAETLGLYLQKPPCQCGWQKHSVLSKSLASALSPSVAFTDNYFYNLITLHICIFIKEVQRGSN
jgi:hypothetical protein